MNSSSLSTPRTSRQPADAAKSKDGRLSSVIDAEDLLGEMRNSPEAHRRNYEDAQREHERVLKAALHVYELHQLAEANRQIEEEELCRRKRVAEEEKRIAQERAAKAKQLEDEARLAAQKAAPLPTPVIPPPQPPAPAPAPAPKTAAPPSHGFALQTTATSAAPPPSAAPEPAKQPQAQTPSVLATKPLEKPAAPSHGLSMDALTNGAASARPAQPGPALQPAPAVPVEDRHMEVHKSLKQLRKFVAEQAKTNPVLKAKMGDMRRDIRKSLGQLTSGGLKENKIPVQRLVTVLHAGLKDVPSELLDPNQFLLKPIHAPVEGALHNEDRLPSLFLYLLNVLSKAAISQFVNESGADPRTAESIGQAVVKVYSELEFLWRGKSMIDMLIAKYRIVCPVLFGFHGNDRTERGRGIVGWKKENGRWITEQYHLDRMTGLGAGFAALTLRDFTRAKRPNPWPPSVYWTALAKIVNTPPAGMSDTQCYVLKAMIANYESRFITFYGNAAVAALRCALVDYPGRVPKPTGGTEILKVLAKSIALKTGLELEA